jgi:hypothetical protein
VLAILLWSGSGGARAAGLNASTFGALGAEADARADSAAGPAGKTAAPSRDLIEVSGQVKDPAGVPVANVTVFAADDATDVVASFANSDASGRVVLRIPRTRHNFGVLSSKYGVVNIAHAGVLSFVMQVKPLSATTPERTYALVTFPLTLEGAKVVRGKVVDEAGNVLAGVRVEALRDGHMVAAAAVTDARGQFALGLTGGRFRLRALAPGLKLAKGVVRGDVVEIAMAIDAVAEQISVVQGHVLKFRLDQSVDPEIFPPAPVRAWLCWSYGVVVQSRTPTASERKRIKKYWYLDVLRNPPPNPAKALSWDGTCVPEENDRAAGRAPLGPGAYRRPLIEVVGDSALPPSVFAR